MTYITKLCSNIENMHIGAFIYVDCLIYKLSSIEKQETPYYNNTSTFVLHKHRWLWNTKDDYLDLLLDILNMILVLCYRKVSTAPSSQNIRKSSQFRSMPQAFWLYILVEYCCRDRKCRHCIRGVYYSRYPTLTWTA